MKKVYCLKIFAAFCLFAFSASAHDAHNSRPDGHAPIGVMRDHFHKKGEYMLSYRYDLMSMSGAREGTRDLSSADVLSKYTMSPSKMTMKMHMAGVMYGVTDNFTLTAMASFVEKDMKMFNRSYQKSEKEISGFGDLKLNAMYGIFDEPTRRAQFNLGLSVPSGSIKETYDGARVAYPMQLGSGSYEVLPGVSYSGYKGDYSYGAQLNGTFRINDNNSGYRLGDSHNITAWTAKKLSAAFSVSSRLDYTVTQKTKGYDKVLNTMMNLSMSPANNPKNSGRKSLDFLLGANFIMPKGYLKGHRLAIEGGVPLYQNINGIQLKNDYKLTLGWQKSF
ncbi:MAG: hypothetical protein KA100_02095 [Rickettsiales bacterium]|nr:hypothetical protein [Rickettsiales bacterium]